MVSRSQVRRWLVGTIIVAPIGIIVEGVVQAFIGAYMQEKGWLNHPTTAVGLALNAVRGTVLSSWFQLTFVALAALVAGMFLNEWLRRNEIAVPIVQSPMGQSSVPWSWSMTTISGRIYTDEEVEIDGKCFDHCTFVNVTLMFRGTATYAFIEPKWVNGAKFMTSNPVAKAAVTLTENLWRNVPHNRRIFATKDSNSGQITVLHNSPVIDAPVDTPKSEEKN